MFKLLVILFIIDLYFLIPAVNAKNYNPAVEPGISIRIATKKTHPVTAEAKMSKYSI